MQETTEFWRHRSFPELTLLKARFTQHRYERHTHATYVIALITGGCERVCIGRQDVVAPVGLGVDRQPGGVARRRGRR